jgi:alpha-N-arabinofuranosidase
VIIFEGRGRLWLDQVSLMPADAVNGVRRDVLNKVKDLRPAFLRWPGGNVAQDYHWEWAVGPRDERTTWTNLSWKNEPEPSDFGTPEFISLSRTVGAEPAITVNVEGRGATVEEAAAWVEYCNGSASTKYGSLRIAHGYSQPFNVKLWEIGNEIWGPWVRGHSDAEIYARNLNRYATAMRKVDASIKLIAVGDNNMEWNRKVVSNAGSQIDYLAIHHYYGRTEIAGDSLNLMARPLFYQRFYQQVSQMLNELSPRHPIQLAINEWGLDLPLEQQYSMLSALYGARLMNVFERSGGLVAMSAVSDLINGWPGGIIQASRDGLFVSPIYVVNQLYAEKLGSEVLESEVRGPTFDSSREGKAVSHLDVVASRSTDRKNIFIKVVNASLESPLTSTISLKGVVAKPRVEVATINSQRLSDANSFASPEAITLKRSVLVSRSNLTITFPAHSVTVLTLAIQE